MTPAPRHLGTLLLSQSALLDPGPVGRLALEWLAATTDNPALDGEHALPSTVRAVLQGRGVPVPVVDMGIKEALGHLDRLRREERTKAKARQWSRAGR